MTAVEFVGAYDPAENDDYDLTKDPRCLYGWACPGNPWGHDCERPFGHRGKCMAESATVDVGKRVSCETKQRPKNWDATGRAEANR